jgi:phosphoribosylformimino-5-aminoimidazole carboxamide ribotide isomerase
LDVARAFRDQLGLSEIYIADLDAIMGRGNHWEIINKLTFQEKMGVMLDAGASDPRKVQDLLALGIKKVIVGTETLPGWEALLDICEAIPGEALIFSLDMRSGKVFSRSRRLESMSPLEILGKITETCVQEVILLDLDRVGTQTGINLALINEARQRFQEINLIVGGGIRQVSELDELQLLGVSGVLVASALHKGIITKQNSMHYAR